LATIEDFLALDVRVGTVLSAQPLRGARTPALRLSIHFGDLGTKTSTAQITEFYDPEELVGLQVVAVCNLPPRRVAGVDSEVLILAANGGTGEAVLLMPDRPVPDGVKVS
jgi:tRNA-binding protein